QRSSNPLPDDIGPLTRELILALRVAARESSAGAEPAEAVRRSINQSLKRRGERKTIDRFRPTDGQRAIGRLITASMSQRRQRPDTTGVPTALPAIPGYQMLRLL